MTRRTRIVIFLIGAVGVGGVVIRGMAGLPDFGSFEGRLGKVLTDVAVHERHTTNVVTSIVFDYRGVDTMGEETILFAAAVSVALLLRVARGERERAFGRRAAQTTASTSDAIRVLGLGLVGPTVVLGAYLVAHGTVTPGGGFQGGAVLASASMLVVLSGSYPAFRRVNPIPLIDAAEGVGVAGYPAIGLLGLLSGATFLANVVDLGTAGRIWSGGTMALLNVVVGLSVSAGVVLIASEFLEQTLAIRRRVR
jgi:multicomponent Na+:H+ antiporter subunit B